MKKNVITKIIVVIFFGTLCLYQIQHLNNTDKEKKGTSHIPSTIITEYVIVTKTTSLYEKKNNKFIKSDQVEQNASLLIGTNKKGMYYQLQNLNKYILCNDVKPTSFFERNRNYLRYLVFNENLITKKYAKLYDRNGVLKYTSIPSLNLPIYMKEADKLYTLHNDELLGVSSSDVVKIVPNQNTNNINIQKIPVFMYHFFYNAAAGEVGSDGNFIEIGTFRNHLAYANDNGYQSLTMEDIYLYMKGAIQLPPKSYAITMDDNSESVKRLAYPVLEDAKVFATNFIISSWHNEFSSFQSKYVELQSHSHAMHTGGCSGQGQGGRLLCIDYNQGIEDLKKSSELLNKAFVLAYPFGDVNETVKKMLHDTNYRLAFTVKPGKITRDMDMLELPRVRITKNTTVEVFAKLLDE